MSTDNAENTIKLDDKYYMRPKEIFEFLDHQIKYHIEHYNESNSIIPIPVFLWGPPGVGKSSIFSQVAEANNIGFTDMRLAQKDPSDLRGALVPNMKKRLAEWLPPDELPSSGEGIILLDELPLAAPLVQSSAYQLVHDRKVGNYVVPGGYVIYSAGNKAEHGAHVYQMAAPLCNRFVHIYFKLSQIDWNEWAMKNNQTSEVIEFVNFRPDALFSYNPARHIDAFPSPRTWEFVSRLITTSQGMSKTVLKKAICGAVGVAATIEFYNYLEIRSKLPKVDDVLNGQDYIPKELDICLALITAMVIKAKKEQIGRVLQYSEVLAENFSDEITVLAGKLLIKRDKIAVTKDPYFLKTWAHKYAKLISAEI